MPGIFGGVSPGRGWLDALAVYFGRVFDAPATVRCGQGLLGGHASGSAAIIDSGRFVFGYDGEVSVYRRPGDTDSVSRCSVTAHGLELADSFAGNAASYDADRGEWHLASSWAGAFPLYYLAHEGAFLFSSHVRPLALAVQAAPDNTGILQYLRKGYTVSNRTLFEGITRLLPGQVLCYATDRASLRLRETSRLWTAPDARDRPSLERLPERMWEELNLAVRRSIPHPGSHALMLSGGWDSRTLLDPLVRYKGSENLFTYSHGDQASRELRIARDLSRTMDVRHVCNPIDDNVLDPDLLSACALRAESASFPHWYRAGLALTALGVSSVSSGIFGEILGGHYGTTFTGHAGQRMRALARGLVAAGRPARRDQKDGLTSAFDLLCVSGLRRHWYISETFWARLDEPEERINADVLGALRRLKSRGVSSSNALLEAYHFEHRAARRITGQLLAVRSHVDVAFPLADQQLLLWVSRIPFSLRIHNRLNRDILHHAGSPLLSFPLAATLVRAAAPLWLQEASRGVRKMGTALRTKLHHRARGIVSPARLSWVNFDFMRTSPAIWWLVDDLRLDIWDRSAIRKELKRLQEHPLTRPSHPFFDQFMKIYSIDLLLRT